ncbi:phosphatidylserine decarboxylase [Deinococcus lacus]|uniref:Phosphatidylserine decarboxylase n=1 Tax=Deinococcus lacus TaxID=392561 RepID=A0ABW1YAW4_9DEIO
MKFRSLWPAAAGAGALWYLRSVHRFRDPVRVPAEAMGALLAPADGLVSFVRRVEGGRIAPAAGSAPSVTVGGQHWAAASLLGAERQTGWVVGIYVGPLDTHYVYVPASGQVQRMQYQRTPRRRNLPLIPLGGRLPLFLGQPQELLGRAAASNERHTTEFHSAGNQDYSVTLVADSLGLRATTYLQPHDQARAGNKLAFLAEGGWSCWPLAPSGGLLSR